MGIFHPGTYTSIHPSISIHIHPYPSISIHPYPSISIHKIPWLQAHQSGNRRSLLVISPPTPRCSKPTERTVHYRNALFLKTSKAKPCRALWHAVYWISIFSACLSIRCLIAVTADTSRSHASHNETWASGDQLTGSHSLTQLRS